MPLFASAKKLCPPRRPSLGRSGGVFLLALGLAPLLGGCSWTPPSLLPVATPPPVAVQRQKEAARFRSVNEAFSKLDAKTVNAWIDRWTNPGAASRPGAPKAVRIDTDALARRHPAWQLAAALEKGAISPDSPQIARALAVGGPAFTPASLPGDLTPVTRVPVRTVRDRFNGQQARQRQSDALDQFFTSAAARDRLRDRDEAYLARRNLEDAIAAAQRGAVAELDLSLIPDDVALELTNLRLELLRTLSRTAAQRAASRARIQAIEARFVELWRQQTELQAARVREATIGLPARLRLEGRARIEREAQSEAEKRSLTRLAVAQEAKRDLRADFARPVPDLTLVLPATRRVGDVPIRTGRRGAELFETMPLPLSSTGRRNRQALATSGRFDSRVVSALRAKAQREAREWATLVAAQLGSRWDNNLSNPDKTATALAILFPQRAN
jgi:hypothetical protein